MPQRGYGPHQAESQALVLADGVTTAGVAMAHLDLAVSVVRRLSPALSDLAAVYLAIGDRPRQSDGARPTVASLSDPVLSAFERAVRAGLGEPLTVSGIARDIGISPRLLPCPTSTVLGLSPVHYIQQVRLERAVQCYAAASSASPPSPTPSATATRPPWAP